MVTLLLHENVPPGVERVRLSTVFPAPINGTEPANVEPPNIRFEFVALVLIRPVPDEPIELPFIVKVCPVKLRFPKLRLMIPSTSRFDPRTTLAVRPIVKLFKNSEPGSNVNVPKAPLPLNVKFDDG